jgi:hypothetical protein
VEVEIFQANTQANPPHIESDRCGQEKMDFNQTNDPGGNTSSTYGKQGQFNDCDDSEKHGRNPSQEEDEGEWRDVDDSEDPLAPKLTKTQSSSRQQKRRRNSIRRSVFLRNNRLLRTRGQSILGEYRDGRTERPRTSGREVLDTATSSLSSREASPARSVRWKDLEVAPAAEKPEGPGDIETQSPI